MAEPEVAHPPVHKVQITVNERPVTVAGPHATGLAIKEAAIAQGLPIKLDFVLSQEFPGRKTKLIRDDEVVTVTPESRFSAIPNDDNSEGDPRC